jgi:hypothetical protein
MARKRVPEAKKGRGFVAPKYKRYVGSLLRILALPYLKVAEQVSRLRYRGMEHLAGAFNRFHGGGERLIIMFRHVAKEDAPVMVRLIVRELPRWCRRAGISLKQRPHVHFLYGKDVLNWAGAGARWLFPRIGGIPVVNTKLDRESQGAIRETLVSGEFPLAFAPEGQVTYHMFKTAPLVPGAATLADWAYTGVRNNGGNGAVTILPVSIAYTPKGGMEETFQQLLAMVAAKMALPMHALGVQALGEGDQGRVEKLAEIVIDTLESSYASQYPGIFKEVAERLKPVNLQERYNALCETVLRCAESALGWLPLGTTLERIFRIRYRVMESFHREDIDPEKLSRMDKNRADFRALQALVLKRHSELADILEYIDFSYLEKPGTLRKIEFLLNLLDLLNRFEGGNINSRFTLKKKEARLIIGRPFRGDPFFMEHPGSRKTGREALTRQLLDDYASLQRELEEWIGED